MNEPKPDNGDFPQRIDNPLAKAAIGGGAVAFAAIVTAGVLLAVGISLVVAGLFVLGGLLVGGVSLPFAFMGKRRRRREVDSGDEPDVIEARATVRKVTEGDAAKSPDRVRKVLQRLEKGEISPEEALEELDSQ